VRNKTEGWKSLGGILLCFTGSYIAFLLTSLTLARGRGIVCRSWRIFQEVRHSVFRHSQMLMKARRAIQISWLGFAYPCLLMAYIGQAAHISVHPSAYSNPFFNSVPPGMFWPSLIVSILAAIVASQALITSTFQLLFQLVNMSYFPPIKMVNTSVKYHSQIYIPFANWLMMIGTIVVTAVFKDVHNCHTAKRRMLIYITDH
jgi:KUP system potassium uptake protein